MMTNASFAPELLRANDTRGAHSGRDAGLDAVRCIATLMVILIHISGTGFPNMAQQHWWAVNAYESVSRAAVPLFFMITGALLLTKDHTPSTIVTRIWRVALPLIVWSVIYKLWDVFVGKQPFLSDVQHWLPAILSNPVAGHLWYLYALIPAYAFTPVLAKFIQHTSSKLAWFVIACGILLASFIPFINTYFKSPVIGFGAGSFYIYGMYMLAGAVLYRDRPARRNTVLIAGIAWISSVIIIAVCTWAKSTGGAGMTELFYEYWSPCVVVSAIAAFICIRACFGKFTAVKSRISGTLDRFSRLSFGVYLVHPMIIWTFAIQGFGFDAFNQWLAIPVLLILVVLVSSLITATLQRIPGVRRIVLG